MGPDWYLLQQQEQHHLPEELDRWYLTGSWYLLLQQEQQHLPEVLDSGQVGPDWQLVPTPATGATPSP